MREPQGTKDANAWFVRTALTREPGQKYTSREPLPFPVAHRNSADHRFRSTERAVNFEYDFKRQLVTPVPKVVSVPPIGESEDPLIVQHLSCNTIPWRTVDEFNAARDLFEEWRHKQRGQLRTMGDWQRWEQFQAGTGASRRGIRRSKDGVVGGMAEREPEVPEERRIRFRIGINVGDVIAEERDIFGDGVNVAARLEGLAAPGGISISGTVRDHIGDRLPYSFEDLGEQSVKNIARPVRAYALRPEAIALLPANAPTAPPTPQPVIAPRLSIVVLPFANLSNDPDQQYFADGITEDLTTDLSRLADMLVISRNTAFTYQGKRVNTKQMGRELAVRYVLEGSVRRSGSRVRVNAQLIDAETDVHLWAERFEGDAGDLFALQDEVTSRIAVELNLELVRAEVARPLRIRRRRIIVFGGVPRWPHSGRATDIRQALICTSTRWRSIRGPSKRRAGWQTRLPAVSWRI
jgi:TolB-like protein